MIETQISILTELAGRDGHIDEKETALIQRIGQAHGLTEQAVQAMINKPVQIDWNSLNLDERFDMLHNVVQLMKADGEIFDEEISYCMDVAQRLGFPLEAVMEMYPIVHSNLKLPTQVSKVRMKYMDYLKSKGLG
jgi:uncharacterized tellurite resistance protein B-like protein